MTASGDTQFCYKMYPIRRGRAFIINNEFYHDLDQGQRTLTDRDAENVLSLLSEFEFDITVRNTAAQMKSMLVKERLAQPEELGPVQLRGDQPGGVQRKGFGMLSERSFDQNDKEYEDADDLALYSLALSDFGDFEDFEDVETAQCKGKYKIQETLRARIKRHRQTMESLSMYFPNDIDAPRDTLRKVRPYPKELRDDTEENKFVFIPNRRGLGKRDNKAAYFNTPDNRNKRQDDCDQDRAAKDDRTQKRNLVAIVTGSVTRSSTGHQTGRTDVFVGNGNLLNESFRQQHNIRNIVTVKVIPLNADVAVDLNTKLRVRMRPIGEGKDSWEHCINQDGNVALPEAQFLCISQLLCGRSSFPASATWFLETPKKCPPSSTLEAVVEIELVTPDAIKRRDASSSAVNLVLSVEIQEKEVPNIYSDPELSSLWLNTDIDRDDRALEEKSQTEAMEK